MIATNLSDDSRANLKIAERVSALRIEPDAKRGDRWVICDALGERATYLSDRDGIALFRSADDALKFIQATRPDLAESVELGELVEGKAARPNDPAPGNAPPCLGRD